MKSINPFNNTLLYDHEVLSSEQVNHKLQLAQRAFEHHRNTSFAYRSEKMLRAARILRENRQQYARTITEEMGKPISQAVAEVEKCAWVCEYYAENAESQLQSEYIKTDARESYVAFEPLGVVLAVMPWNYPFWQVFRFAAPALMAGNIGVLKHASNVMRSAGNIEEVFIQAGFPAGCFQYLAIESGAVAEIIRNGIIKAITLTGSKPAGASVAAVAGGEIKKSVLELGGSNALVVFEDADLESAVDVCVSARFQNTGQSCIAGKRLLLQRKISDDFIASFIRKVAALKTGDPLEETTYIGVLAREDLARDLEKQVKDSVTMGARVLLGGGRKGTFFEPTVVTGVTPAMPMFKEETFGPAIGVTVFEKEEDAVDLVNRSEFGLGVSVFTSSRERASRLIPRFSEGAVFINELVKSDPRLPFGGVKDSGYGRELSRHGILEFVNKKTVYINMPD